MYNGEIIQIAGGLNDYIGELDQSVHPMGMDWYRIKNPCITFTREDTTKKTLETVVARMSGPPGKNLYRKFVDLRIPDCAPMEIRVLDKSGGLYKTYKAQIEKKKSLIIVPDMDIKTQ